MVRSTARRSADKQDERGKKGKMSLPEKDKIIAVGKKKNGGLVTL